MTNLEYVRVKVKGRNKFWAIVETRGPRFTIYLPVNKEGVDKSYYKGDVVIIPKELVENTLIISEELAVMSKTYGWLEVSNDKQ